MATQDILMSVPSPLPLLVLDSILHALTHPNTVRRRTALALVVLYFVLAIRLLALLRNSLNFGRSATAKLAHSTPLDADDKLVYDPSPPATLLQKDNLARLVKMIDDRHSAFPPARFTSLALAHPSNEYVAVTAVVLHWKRRKGLQLVLKQLSKYSFIREIIVWNNHPGVSLKASDFALSTALSSELRQPRLRIFNSPSNVHDSGKHFACSLATTDHCYFNDDDWLNIYLDAHYTKYLDCCAHTGPKNVGRIASNTMPIIHLEHRRWRFENPDIALNTGFTWLGTGSFAPKALSLRFLNQQSAAPAMLSREQTLVSDMFFSLWTNSYPEQMPNDLVPIDVEGVEVGWSKGVDQWSIVHGNILDGIRKLHDILTIQDPYLCPDPFPTNASPPESQLRAPCANDKCLFSTSLTPFPHPSTLTYPRPTRPSFWSRLFSSSRHHPSSPEQRSNHEIPPSTSASIEPRFDPYQISHVHEHEKRFSDMPTWPGDEWWITNGSWHLAVDGKPHDQTCWTSHQPPNEDDSFGLTFVRPVSIRDFTLVGSSDLASLVSWEALDATADSWQILTVREDAIPHEVGGWEPRRLVGPVQVRHLRVGVVEIKGQLEVQEPRDEEVEQKDEQEGNEPAVVRVKRIKFVSKGKKVEPLRVCGFEMGGYTI